MSVIYHDERQDHYVLLCKGADEVISCKSRQSSGLQQVLDSVRAMAKTGLRTLVYAKRIISKESFKDIQMQYMSAKSSSAIECARKIHELSEMLESDMVVIGAIGIEDRLQQDVPETIEKLRLAGIAIWMITGDKMETAVAVARSCKIIDDDDDDAIIVSGTQLVSNWKSLVSDNGVGARSVICYRASPLQKCTVAKLLKEHGNMVVCAIGDGANDVAMIQEAPVGIGISGREGRQACNVSDYEIGQFRFVARLILFHGYWNYCRNSRFLLGSLYKMLAFFMTLFFYQFYNGFSASMPYEMWSVAMYNEVWSLVLVLASGLFDQEQTEAEIECDPTLFGLGQGHGLSNMRFFLSRYFVISIYQALVVVGMVAGCDRITGFGMYGTGLVMYSCILVTVQAKLFLFNCARISWPILLAFLGQLSLWFLVFLPFLDSSSFEWQLQGMYTALLQEPVVYLVMLATVTCSLIPDFAFHLYNSFQVVHHEKHAFIGTVFLDA